MVAVVVEVINLVVVGVVVLVVVLVSLSVVVPGCSRRSCPDRCQSCPGLLSSRTWSCWQKLWWTVVIQPMILPDCRAHLLAR